LNYLKFFKLIMVHKWFVFFECLKRGLIWRGIKHDIDKLFPKTFIIYTNYSYNNKNFKREKNGFYDPENDPIFLKLWVKHHRKNDHHWQYWTYIKNKEIKTLPMSKNAIIEMMCDWYGASMAFGRGGWETIPNWYKENKHLLIFHKKTKKEIELFLENIKINDK